MTTSSGITVTSVEAGQIEPCPFCGAGSDELMLFADPDEGRDNSGPSRRIQCAVCHIEAPFYDSEPEAIAAWNRRALSQDRAATNDAVAGVKVKPLEWGEYNALGGGTKLVAHDCFGNEFARLDLPRKPEYVAWFKRDRQGDYERRILSALTPSPLPAQERPAAVVDEAMRDGVALIAAERRRQVQIEDFDASHDDMATKGQLAGAAACYAISGVEHWAAKRVVEQMWPWDAEWWKPTDRIRDLTKAGALIAAEIDRLQRRAALSTPTQTAGGEQPSATEDRANG